MAQYYNTPHTSWMNQPKSYWVPLRMAAHALAYIRTVVVRAAMKIGSKWTGYDITSERVD